MEFAPWYRVSFLTYLPFSTWKTELLVPAYLSALSFTFLLLQALVASLRSTKLWLRFRQPDSSHQANGSFAGVDNELGNQRHSGLRQAIGCHISAMGGPSIFIWRFIRLVCCTTLLFLASFIKDAHGRVSGIIETPPEAIFKAEEHITESSGLVLTFVFVSSSCQLQL